MKSSFSLGRLLLSSALLTFVAISVARAENPDDRARLLQTRECAGCDLSDAKLTPTDLSGVSAPTAIFRNAMMYRANLKDADLKGADLSNANLEGADLTNTKLTGANLDGANLSKTTGANLTGTVTTSATTCPSGSNGPCQ
jgi:uncharacterized protein YjbI with pentapeptide repeats